MTNLPKLIAAPALLGAALVLVPAVALAGGFAHGSDAPGTIALRATEVHGLTLASAGMMPGDSITGALHLRNDGDGELRYSVTTSAVDGANDAGALSTVLAVTVRTTDIGAADGEACDEGSGLVVRAGATLDADGHLVGDPAQGSDPGDRTIAAGGSEILCFTVGLPLSVGNEFQGVSSTVSFAFVSEASASNP